MTEQSSPEFDPREQGQDPDATEPTEAGEPDTEAGEPVEDPGSAEDNPED